MSFLRNKFDLCVLDLPEDFNPSLSDIFKKLQSKKFEDISLSDEFADGWANISDMFKDFSMEDTVLVNSVVGGYRTDRKKVPSALIKKLFLDKLKEKSKEGVKLSKKEKKDIKQECKSQLLMKALPVPKLTSWIMDLDKKKVYLGTKSASIVNTFVNLFTETFEVPLVVAGFSLEEDDLSHFLDYLWESLEESSSDSNFWINQEVTLDFDKNTFKFNGPRIEEYKEDIENFKKSKKIKSINIGMKISDYDYSVTFNNKNMFLGVESMDKIKHESSETALLDNQDRINMVIDKVSSLISNFNK